MPTYARDLGGIYNYYVGAVQYTGYPHGYDLGSYRGGKYYDGNDGGVKHFPYSNINIGMFYNTNPTLLSG